MNALILPLLINALLAAYCARRRWLSSAGAWAGFNIGSAITLFLGWAGWAILGAFFFGGTAATFLGWGRKRRRGVAQADQGRRGWRNAWANAGAGVLFAALAWFYARQGRVHVAEAWRWAFVASFAAALADTLSSEFGLMAGQMPRLITTGKRVPIGTDGGITRAGTLMGIAGAAGLTLLGRFLDVVPVRATLPVLVAGLSGNLLDSYLGATLQRRGILSNDTVNLANTLAGGALGFGGYWFMNALPQWMRALGIGHVDIIELFI